MGFFSGLVKAAKWVVQNAPRIVQAVSTAAQAIGSIFGGWGNRRSQEPAFTQEKASGGQIVKVNNDAAWVVKQMQSEINQIEAQYYELVEQYANGILSGIEGMPVGAINDSVRQIKNKMSNKVINDLLAKFSIDNKRLLNVLAMNEGSQKRQEIHKFWIDAVAQSIDDLDKILNDGMTTINSLVTESQTFSADDIERQLEDLKARRQRVMDSGVESDLAKERTKADDTADLYEAIKEFLQ